MRIAKTTLCLALSFAIPLVYTGCGKTKTGDDKKTGKSNNPDDGGHPTAGPHGGVILEVGKDHQYHGEFLIDRANETITVYILDNTGKKVKPIKATEVTISFSHAGKQEKTAIPAKPLEGEKDGVSSRFELKDEDLAHELGDHDDANPSLHFTVDGKLRSGAFKVPPKKK